MAFRDEPLLTWRILCVKRRSYWVDCNILTGVTFEEKKLGNIYFHTRQHLAAEKIFLLSRNWGWKEDFIKNFVTRTAIFRLIISIFVLKPSCASAHLNIVRRGSNHIPIVSLKFIARIFQIIVFQIRGAQKIFTVASSQKIQYYISMQHDDCIVYEK